MPYAQVSQLEKAVRSRRKFEGIVLSVEHHERLTAKAKVEMCTRAQLCECLIKQFVKEL